MKVYDTIDGLPAPVWDGLTSPDFPFGDADFLRALEQSGAVGGLSGWHPIYLADEADGRLNGASFLFAKTNSNGEYIFDWSWADAYRRHGVSYFPKLTAAVPFTPATGPKLLLSSACDQPVVAGRLIEAGKRLMKEGGHSSLHYLFLTAAELPFFHAAGFFIRHSFQYHWHNRGYASFDDFLAALKPKRRKQIVREREQLKAASLTIDILTGDQLTAGHARIFFQFYLTTIDKREAIPYLNEQFFEIVFDTMRDRIVLMLASEAGQPIAGALYYKKGDHLFGRYWGAVKEVRNLHFELCYYQPIVWAIQHKLRVFEAGAQGEHKIARGFVPVLTYSAHFLEHPAFCEAIGLFVEQEKSEIARIMTELNEHSPYAH